jgi:hypothetical protein
MVSRSQLPSLYAVAALALLGGAPVYAQDEEPAESVAPQPLAEPVPEAEPSPAPETAPAAESAEAPDLPVAHSEAELPSSVRRHWDAGFEMRYTQFDGTSEPMLHAQWLRHWPSGFKLGGFLSALALEIKREKDGVKSRTHFYALGLTCEYDVFGRELDYPSISIGGNLGQGWFNRRTEVAGVKEFKQTDIYVVEPYLVAQFGHWRRLEWGAGLAYRVASSTDEKRVEDQDVSGVSAFLSARHEI